LAYHHGDLRRVLLENAAQVVEAEGPAALSLRAVARRAGVSHGAPARHFADKAALLTAVATEGMRNYHEALTDALRDAGDTGLARARAAALHLVRFTIEHPGASRLASHRELFDANDPAFVAAEQAVFDLVRSTVAAAQREGLASDADPTALLIAIWSTLHGLAMLWLGGRLDQRLGPLDLDTLIDQVIDFTIDARVAR
jgi:AcrR family transcriptional regulator